MIEVTIANQTLLQAKALSFSVTGDAAGDFMVDGCEGVALGPEETCKTALNFISNTAGKRTAKLVISADNTTSVDLFTDVFTPQ